MSASTSSGKPERRRLDRESMGIETGLPLEVGGESPEALRKAVQMLLDIEAIKQLKHAYFRCLDTANTEELAGLFHENVSVHFVGGSYEWTLEGRDEYVEAIGKSFHKESVGQHNGHHPEIQILSDTEATGIWYLADHMWILNHKFLTQGTALYWDRYVKHEGRWLIKETRYERLYEINSALDANPQLSSHYLAVHGPAPEKG